MLFSLKYQIFHFWFEFVSFTQFSRQVFQNLALSLYSIYGKIPSCKKLRNLTNKMWRTDRQADRWTDEHDWLFKNPSVKMVVWSCFPQIQELNFLKLYGLIVSLMERLNTRKRNTINIVQCSKREQWKYIN